MQRDMEYVYAVYKTGGISKAADEMFVTQPTISMAIQRTEAELGYLIFDRRTHPLQPTEVGKLFISHIENIRRSEMALQNKIDSIRNIQSGKLRIGCTPLHSMCLVPSVLSRVSSITGGIDISLINAFPKEMMDKLKNNVIDIAVSTKDDVEQEGLQCIPAFNVDYLMAIPRSFPVNASLAGRGLSAADIADRTIYSEKAPVPLSVFSTTPMIVLSEGTDFYDQSRKMFEQEGFVPITAYTVSAPLTAYKMTKLGMAATLVGSFSVDPADSGIIYYKLDSPFAEKPFCFVLRGDSEPTPVQQLFIQVFQEYVS